MKKLLVFIAAVSFTAVTFAQSAQTTQTTAPAKAETKKECSVKGKDKACCKKMKACTDEKAESKEKASVAPAKTASTPKN